jgi:hypothetical protein
MSSVASRCINPEDHSQSSADRVQFLTPKRITPPSLIFATSHPQTTRQFVFLKSL